MPAGPEDLARLRLPRIPPALFLDVDGTLIEIAPRPDQVRIPPRLPPLLLRLNSLLDGALALVSGRSLADLDRLFGGIGLAAAGQHGLELRDPTGSVTRTAIDGEELAEITAQLEGYVRSAPGTLLEEKGMTVALHFRNVPEREAEARALAQALLQRHGERFHVQEGKMVLEFKPRGVDKGTVIERFMTLPPFAGRLPVFVGDDVTDEHGFAAVNRLGGISIQVGDREPTAAGFRTPSVGSMASWLEQLAAALDGAGPSRED